MPSPRLVVQWWRALPFPAVRISAGPTETIWGFGIAGERSPGQLIVALLVLRWELQLEVSA